MAGDINLETIVDYTLEPGKIKNTAAFQAEMNKLLSAVIQKLDAPTALLDIPVHLQEAQLSPAEVTKFKSSLNRKLKDISDELGKVSGSTNSADKIKAQGLATAKSMLEGIQGAFAKIDTVAVSKGARKDVEKLLADPLHLERIVKSKGGNERIQNVRAYLQYVDDIRAEVATIHRKASAGTRIATGSGDNFAILDTLKASLPEYGVAEKQLKKQLQSLQKLTDQSELVKQKRQQLISTISGKADKAELSRQYKNVKGKLSNADSGNFDFAGVDDILKRQIATTKKKIADANATGQDPTKLIDDVKTLRGSQKEIRKRRTEVESNATALGFDKNTSNANFHIGKAKEILPDTAAFNDLSKRKQKDLNSHLASARSYAIGAEKNAADPTQAAKSTKLLNHVNSLRDQIEQEKQNKTATDNTAKWKRKVKEKSRKQEEDDLAQDAKAQEKTAKWLRGVKQFSKDMEAGTVQKEVAEIEKTSQWRRKVKEKSRQMEEEDNERDLRSKEKQGVARLKAHQQARKLQASTEKEAGTQFNAQLGEQALNRVGGYDSHASLRQLRPDEQSNAATFLKQRAAEIPKQQQELVTKIQSPTTAPADVARFREEHKRLGEELPKVKAALGYVNKEINGMTGFMHQASLATQQFLRYAVLYAAGYKAMQGLGALVTGSLDLDKSLHQIQAITQASDSSMKTIAAGIKGVTSASQFSLQEVSSAAEVLAQAGVELDKLPGILSVTAKLAATTGADMKSTADVITSLSEVFERTSTSEVTALADQVAQAVNISKLSTEGMKTIISLGASTAKTSGLQSQQFFGAAATLSNKGIKDSTIATGLRETMLELFAPDDKMLSYLKQRYTAIGEDVTTAFIKSQFQAFQHADNPMLAALTELKRLGVSGAGKADFNRVTDIRAQNILLPLIESLDKLSENTAKIAQSGGIAQGATTQMQAFDNAVNNLGQTLISLTHDIVEEALPSLTSGIKALKNGIASIREPVVAAIEHIKHPFSSTPDIPEQTVENVSKANDTARTEREAKDAEFDPFNKATKGGQAEAIDIAGKSFDKAKSQAEGILGQTNLPPAILNKLMELGTTGLESSKGPGAHDTILKELQAQIAVPQDKIKDLTNIGAEMANSRSAIVGKVQQLNEAIQTASSKPAEERTPAQEAQLQAHNRLPPEAQRQITVASHDMSSEEFEKTQKALALFQENVFKVKEKGPTSSETGGKRLLSAAVANQDFSDPNHLSSAISDSRANANKGDVESLKELYSAVKRKLDTPTPVEKPPLYQSEKYLTDKRMADAREALRVGSLRKLEAELIQLVPLAEQNKASAEAAKKHEEESKATTAEQDAYRADTNKVYGGRKEVAADKLAEHERSSTQEVDRLTAERELAVKNNDFTAIAAATEKLGQHAQTTAELKLEVALHEFENQYLQSHPIDKDPSQSASKIPESPETHSGIRYLSNKLPVGERANLYTSEDQIKQEVTKGSEELKKAHTALVDAYSEATIKVPGSTKTALAANANEAERSQISNSSETLNFEIDDIKRRIETAKLEKTFSKEYEVLSDELFAKRLKQIELYRRNQKNAGQPPELIDLGAKAQLDLANDEKTKYQVESQRTGKAKEKSALTAELKVAQKSVDYAIGTGDLEELQKLQARRTEIALKRLKVEVGEFEKENRFASETEKQLYIQEAQTNLLTQLYDEQVKALAAKSNTEDKRFHRDVKTSPFSPEEEGRRKGAGIPKTEAELAKTDQFNMYNAIRHRQFLENQRAEYTTVHATQQGDIAAKNNAIQQAMAEAIKNGPPEAVDAAKQQAEQANINAKAASQKASTDFSTALEANQTELDNTAKSIAEYKENIKGLNATFMDGITAVKAENVLAKFEQLNPGFTKLRDQIETNMAGTLDGLTGIIGDFIGHGFTAVKDIQALRDAMMNTYQAQQNLAQVSTGRIGMLQEIQASPTILKESQAVQSLIIDQASTAQKSAEAAARQQLAIAKLQEAQVRRENSMIGQIQQFMLGQAKDLGGTIVKDTLGAGIRKLFGAGPTTADITPDGSQKVFVTNEGIFGGTGGGGTKGQPGGTGGGAGGMLSTLSSLGNTASDAFSAIGKMWSGGGSTMTYKGGATGGWPTSTEIASNAGQSSSAASGAASGAEAAGGASKAMGAAGSVFSIATSIYSMFNTMDNYFKSNKAYDEVMAISTAREGITRPTSDPTLHNATSKTDTNYQAIATPSADKPGDLAGYLTADKYQALAAAAATGAVNAISAAPAMFTKMAQQGQRNPNASTTTGAQQIAETTGAAAQSQSQTAKHPGVRVINVVDPSLVHDFISSSAGEKVILNTMQRNAASIREYIR